MARKLNRDKGIIENPLGSGIWLVDCYLNSQRFRKLVGNKTAAREFYQKIKTEQREGRLFPEKYQRRRVLFSELAKDRLLFVAANHSRPKGNNHLVDRWVNAFKDMDATTVTPSMIENVLGEIKKEGKAPATINHHLVVIKAIYNKAIRDGLLSVNPAVRVKKHKLNNQIVRYLTPGQEEALFTYLSHTYHPITKVAINTGVRQGELLRLTWEDVDRNSGILTIKKSKHGQAHRVPMNSIVQGVLAEVYQNRKTDRIFPHDSSRLRKAFDKAIQSAGLAPFRFHDLRHTFASRLAMQGCNDRTIMALGGWKSPAMLSRYAHLSPTHLWQAIESLTEIKPKAEMESTLKPTLERREERGE